MSDRAAAIATFLALNGWADAERQRVAGDASARRFERLRRARDNRQPQSVILMDSAADDTLAAFVQVARLLSRLDISVPELLAQDVDLDLLLLEDFGDETFDRLLDSGSAPEPLFDLAIDLLIALHQRFDRAKAVEASLPDYSEKNFLEQLTLFSEICLPRFLQGQALRKASHALQGAWAETLPPAFDVPCSLLLRDYHVGNLMRLGGRDDIRACGVIDFQDAGIGPVTYDLVSLLEDARRDVPVAIRERALARYLAAFPALDEAAFDVSCHVLATMRHFRVVAIFVRLAAARERSEYLIHLPRLWRMIDGHLFDPALAPVAEWCRQWLPASARTAMTAR